MAGLAFPSGQCRGRSWPNAYGLCPRSLIARSINQFINSSAHSLISPSVIQATNTVSAVVFLNVLLLRNLSHRRFVLTEVTLSYAVLYCTEL